MNPKNNFQKNSFNCILILILVIIALSHAQPRPTSLFPTSVTSSGTGSTTTAATTTGTVPPIPTPPPAPTTTRTTTTTSTTQQCDYQDTAHGCMTCRSTINYVNTQIQDALKQSALGCSTDTDCTLQSVSSICGNYCLQPVLTKLAQPVADMIMKMNVEFCDNKDFQTKCTSLITSVNSNTSNNSTCPEQIAYCEKRTNTCKQRNKLVAAATEIFATPISIAGIGSNPNGIDNMYVDPLTGVIIATSVIPIPTTDNVSNVISNIPLPPGVIAPPGTTVNR